MRFIYILTTFMSAAAAAPVASNRRADAVAFTTLQGPIGQVNFCDDINFKAGCKTFISFDTCINLAPPHFAPSMDKKASSFEMTMGTKCKFFDKANCDGGGGNSWIAESTVVEDLSRQPGWNDNISSFVCWPAARDDPTKASGHKIKAKRWSMPTFKGNRGDVKICSNPNFGDCTQFSALNQCIDFSGPTFGRFNKEVSSLQVDENTLCEMFTQHNCQHMGGYEGKTCPTRNYANLKKSNWNDVMSSIQCWDKDHLPTGVRGC